MNEDTLHGAVRHGVGTAEVRAGEALGDPELLVKGKVNQVLGEAQEAYGRAKAQAAETFDRVDRVVTERPHAAVIGAVLAGLLVGYFLGVRRPTVIVVRPGHAPPRV